METTPTKLVLFSFFHLLFFLSGQQHGVLGHRPLHGFRPTKLFVFGDSYVDTGNVQKSVAGSWKQPYGITFPGKPAGRFSDGRVSTDYLARFVGIKSPIAYKWRKIAHKKLMYGMNFAFGGSGVFDTLAGSTIPNMTTQIGLFEQVIKEDALYSPADLRSSAALVSVAGNDYATFLAVNGSAEGFPPFIASVVNQMAMDLKKIHGLGVKKILVPSLPPLGCLPRSTSVSSFQKCNGTQNTLSVFHNQLLQQAVAKLNNETRDSAFVVVDLFGAFMASFKSKAGLSLKPCCVGVGQGSNCGSVDGNGAKMYRVCGKPEAAFFWDGVHPTQAGWRSVYDALKANLQEIFA